jgi:phosphatidylserine/phosphatidylglycerophosphate/cardiolipin synthase-like enzyme
VPGKGDSLDGVPDGAPGCPYDGSSPQKDVYFTVPQPGGDLTIEDEILRLLAAAVPGSRVRIAMYHVHRLRVADALVAAAGRGVDVALVVDETNQVEDPPGSGQARWNDAVTALRAALGDGKVIVCGGADLPKDGGACMGTTINHNKFILASALCDGSRDVVAQSSANFTVSQLDLHNNLVVIRDDGALFDAYESYWDDLSTDQQNLGYYRERDGDTGTHVHLFPRRPGLFSGGIDPGSDPIYTMLDEDVDCAAGTHVRVAEPIWNEGRGYIVDLLRDLDDAGCDVQIVYNSASTRDEVKVKLLEQFPGQELRRGMHNHSKLILIDGRVAGADRQLVLTGSHNLTYGALRTNDETLLRIEDEAVYDQFLADWQAIWDAAEAQPL